MYGEVLYGDGVLFEGKDGWLVLAIDDGGGCVFSSDLYVDVSNPTYQRFRNQFRMQTGTTPEKLEIVGFDVMNFMLHVLEKEVRNPEVFLENLKQTKYFQGLLHRYQFEKKPRVNSYLTILKYENNTIELLK